MVLARDTILRGVSYGQSKTCNFTSDLQTTNLQVNLKRVPEPHHCRSSNLPKLFPLLVRPLSVGRKRTTLLPVVFRVKRTSDRLGADSGDANEMEKFLEGSSVRIDKSFELYDPTALWLNGITCLQDEFIDGVPIPADLLESRPLGVPKLPDGT